VDALGAAPALVEADLARMMPFRATKLGPGSGKSLDIGSNKN
jgi:hypothetical protein